ncbi:MAG: GntR family transcriptional regulator [Fibrobacteres bacterium]|nr:GntR family transcriptional regulator [Fibrobacterota bacterium]
MENIESNTSGKREILRSHLLDLIQKGQIKPGEPIPSRNELMEQFGCARATVDYVVGNLEREGVLTSERGKGTFAAQSEPVNSIEAAAIIGYGGGLSWPAEVEQGLYTTFKSDLPVSRFTYDEIQVPSVWERCKSHRALVFVMPNAAHEHYLIEVRKKGIPHLVAYRDPPESSFVCVDVRNSVCELVKKLHKKGCTKIAWFGLVQSRYNFPERRYAGYLEGLLETGLCFRRDWVDMDPSINDVSFLESLFINEKERPDALILAQKPMSTVLPVLERAGIKPGHEIILASLDEIKEGTYPFPVWSLAKMTREIGAESGLLLNEFCRNKTIKDNKQRYIMPPVIEQ